jgi:hypothetical protein
VNLLIAIVEVGRSRHARSVNGSRPCTDIPSLSVMTNIGSRESRDKSISRYRVYMRPTLNTTREATESRRAQRLMISLIKSD